MLSQEVFYILRTYFKNQLDLALTLRDVIDRYWRMEIKEDEFINYIRQVDENNKEKLYKDEDYTSIVKQKLGAKRLDLIDKIIKEDGR